MFTAIKSCFGVGPRTSSHVQKKRSSQLNASNYLEKGSLNAVVAATSDISKRKVSTPPERLVSLDIGDTKTLDAESYPTKKCKSMQVKGDLEVSVQPEKAMIKELKVAGDIIDTQNTSAIFGGFDIAERISCDGVLRLSYLPNEKMLARLNKDALIETPFFLEPQTVEDCYKAIGFIKKIIPNGSSLANIIENINCFAGAAKEEKEFFLVIALSVCIADKLVEALLKSLTIFEEAGIKEEDITRNNIIYAEDKKFKLQIDESNVVQNAISDLELNERGNAVANTFHHCIHDIFSKIEDVVYRNKIELDNSDIYKKLIQDINVYTMGMRNQDSSLNEKIQELKYTLMHFKELKDSLKDVVA